MIQVEEFERVYGTFRGLVYRHALRVVGRHDVAEEVTADVFLALYERRADVTSAMLPGWLVTAAKRRAIDHWRHSGLQQRCEAMLADGPVEPSQSAGFWLVGVKTLKPIHRACLILHYVHGMHRTEIAACLGLSETQVKGLLQYARALVRKALAEVPHATRHATRRAAHYAALAPSRATTAAPGSHAVRGRG